MIPQNLIPDTFADDLRSADRRFSNRGPTEKFGRLVKFPHHALPYLLISVDATVIIFAGVVGGGLYQLAAHADNIHVDSVWTVGPVAALLYALIGHSSGFYGIREAFAKTQSDAARILVQWSAVGLLLTALAFLMKSGASFSRGSVICFGIMALVFLIVARRAAKKAIWSAVSEGKVQGRRIVLLGTRDELAPLRVEGLLERYGLSEVHRVTLPSHLTGGLAMNAAEASAVEEALVVARDKNADELVLALPWSDMRKIELVKSELRVSPLPLQLLPDLRVRSLVGNPSYRSNSSFSVEIQRGPLSTTEKVSKRILDMIGASVGLIALAPLIAFIAIAIKLDSPGPVFFRQRRNGFNSKQFFIFKLRSMTVMENGSAVVQAKRFDPRVTKVGRIIRRTSIDEVPQLFNVLLGEMSLVGPRPHALAHDSHYGNLLADYAFRHHVKPGITGWAQINGFRGETERVEKMKGRVDHDLWYINNWSIILDLKIIVSTCFGLVSRDDAY